MKTLVLAYGTGDAVSTAFRYGAIQNLWADQGHKLEVLSVRGLREDFWRRIAEYDTIINQKALLPCGFARRLFAAGRPVFFEFDDAIWTRPHRPYSWWTQWRIDRRIGRWMRGARGVIAANNHLAAFARRHNPRVWVLPMGLDLNVWQPAPKPRGSEVVLGWLGSAGNVWHLERIREPLRQILYANPNARLKVCCPPPRFDFPFERVPFVPGKEHEFVAGLDIGLLPMHVEPYSLGKSPTKALQYLSCAVPVVGNVHGATAEYLNPQNSIAVETEEEWVAVLQRLIDHPGERLRLGRAGRQHVERHFDLRQVSGQLLRLLMDGQ